jgi:UDP-2,3-diacylglucosamine hydrolase
MENTKKIFLISDAHFGIDDPSTEEAKLASLLDFLEMVRETGDRLIILGDLFDFWFEYRSMIDVKHFPVLAELWHMRKSGIRIDYLLGNHDYWTSGFFTGNLVTVVHDSPVCETIGNKKILLAHGDGLSKNEKGYLFMKSILRSSISRSLFRLLHPDIGAWLARSTSKTSRMQIEKKRAKTARALREFARNKLEEEAYDWIILGHSHQPEISRFGKGIYLNIGDWSEHYSYGLIAGEDLRLEQWDH